MRTLRSLAAVTLTLVCAAPLAAQVTPLGGEMSVSTASGQEHQPAIAFLRDGSVLVWENDLGGIVGRRFDGSGAGRGAAFVLAANDPLPALPFYHAVLRETHEPAIATRPDGSFLAVWTDQMVNRTADIFYDQEYVISSRIVARLFRADGSPASRPWTLSAEDAVAGRARVALASGDSFLVVWQERGGEDPGVHLRRVDRRNGPAGDDVLVGQRGLRPAIAVGANNALVGWERCCGPNNGSQVFVRLFDVRGVPAGDVFKVADDTPRGARAVSIAGQPTGDFLVAFQRALAEDGRATRVYGQLFNRQGAAVGGELALSGGSAGFAQTSPAVGSLANGGWVVSWLTWFNTFSRGAATAASFSRLGSQSSAPFDFNADQQPIVGLEMALATGSDGRVLAAWEGFDAAGARGLRARAARGPAN
jgi:hypothetical protein